ncbi:hypothetical protein CO612_05205 [Lysobacteraceae bacterium NML71-0210]|nr:hypothetical protein CO612_05205 [Xanthomonadaceae bacterium NML71-0210]
MTKILPPRRHLLTHALLLALAVPAAGFAQSHDEHRSPAHDLLDKVKVTATPLHQTAEDLVRPVDVLAGERLDEEKAATLGTSLERLPGIQSSYFGPGVGRPIIRGMDGARVQVLNNGTGSGDVSTVSVDHAVSIEPFMADRIEVLKGPAALLYGSGAIGGAVNVVDGRSPDALLETPFSGRAELRGGNVNDERTGMFRLDGSTTNSGSGWVFHADGLLRETGDIKIPEHAVSAEHAKEHGEERDAANWGKLANSATRTVSAGLGVSYIGERGHFGINTSLYNTRYGVPGHSHADHGHSHGHGHGHGHGHSHGHGEEEHNVSIRLDQHRHELHGGLNDLGWFKTLRFKYAHTDYTHTEHEGQEIGTLFNNKTHEGRIELVHQDIAGWQGAFGLQGTRRNFDATGAEAFVPHNRSRDLGVFWLGQRDFGPVKVELGLRHDRTDIEAEPVALLPRRQNQRDFRTTHASAALRWKVNDAFSLQLGLDRAQRAPTAEELYSNGFHVATGMIEVGDDKLQRETVNRIELGARWRSDRIKLQATGFYADYKDYIYQSYLNLTATRILRDYGTPVLLWAQDDARLHGFELESTFTLVDNAAGHFDLRLFGDVVRGRLRGNDTHERRIRILHGDHTHNRRAWLVEGGNLPRIAPMRAGAELRWEAPSWRAALSGTRVFNQDRVANNESGTPGYTWVNAHLAWHGDTASGKGWEVFIDGRNLLNKEARVHTSYLKDLAPLPGRGYSAGVRFFF